MQARASRSGSGRGAFRRGPLPFGAAMRQTLYRQKLNRCREERGFSLIEVLLAMIFLAIGLLAIAAMQDVAMGSNMKAKRMRSEERRVGKECRGRGGRQRDECSIPR